MGDSNTILIFYQLLQKHKMNQNILSCKIHYQNIVIMWQQNDTLNCNIWYFEVKMKQARKWKIFLFSHKEKISISLLFTILDWIHLIDSRSRIIKLVKIENLILEYIIFTYLGLKFVGSLRKEIFNCCKKVFIPGTRA